MKSRFLSRISVLIVGAFLFACSCIRSETGTSEIGSVLPTPIDEAHWQVLLTHSPFTRTLFLSESLILTGIARVDENPVATLMDTEAAESIAVSRSPTPRGWKLMELSDTEDIEKAVAIVLVESGETIKVRYDKERLKTANQRVKFAAQARSQKTAAVTRSRSGGGGNSSVPAERVTMLKRIDQRELPEGYNPGKGKNQEESHQLHQSYVDRRMAGMSARQRGMVGQMWNQKTTIDPGMSNRGASFVRILEHVAENENR